MKGRLALAASVAAVLVMPVAIAPAGATPVAHAACTQARIAGQSKCIARGQFCKHTRRAEKDYERYGLRCNKQDRNGRWHLT